MLDARLRALWGKARPRDGSRAVYHPLLYHSLDVAAVGEVFLDERPDWLERLAVELGAQPDGLRRLILLLLALHDIGKISRPFQAKAPEHWPVDLLGPMGSEPDGPRHDACGLALLGDRIPLEPLFPMWKPSLRLSLLAPFMGHHGKPVGLPQGAPTGIFGDRCCAAARDFVAVMSALFAAEPLQAPPRAALLRVSWRFAGFAVLADWIGSSQVWFPYEPPTYDASRYWYEIARPGARTALAAAGLGRPPRASSATGFHAVTGIDDPPSAVQRWAEEVSLPEGPLLALIEEVTGGGKT
jgi:CRISPR-associated endonuclease/helicase Cas3